MQSRGIAKASGFTRGICVEVDDFIKLKGSRAGIPTRTGAPEKIKTAEHGQKSRHSEPRLYNAPSLHTVDFWGALSPNYLGDAETSVFLPFYAISSWRPETYSPESMPTEAQRRTVETWEKGLIWRFKRTNGEFGSRTPKAAACLQRPNKTTTGLGQKYYKSTKARQQNAKRTPTRISQVMGAHVKFEGTFPRERFRGRERGFAAGTLWREGGGEDIPAGRGGGRVRGVLREYFTLTKKDKRLASACPCGHACSLQSEKITYMNA